MNELGLMERFANPELFEGLEFGEKMTAGLVTLVMGMGITFIILCIIWGCIVLMGKVFKVTGKKKEEPAPKAAPAPAAAVPVTASAPEKEESAGFDPALVAVIMAAISASEGGIPLDTLRVSRITRVSGTRPVWGNAGISDALESRTW